jgi:hypothetical protein
MSKCPWFPDGKHRNGCGCNGGAPSSAEAKRRGKQARELYDQQQKVADSLRKKAENYVNRFRNTRFTTYAPPNTNGMPPGVHMVAVEYRGEKMYKVELE